MKTEIEKSDPNDPAEQALDQLLALARWTQPLAQSQVRLEHAYSRQMVRRRIFRFAWGVSGCVAAAALIAIAYSLIVPEFKSMELARPVAIAPIARVVAHGEPISRQPTPYEQLIMIRPRAKKSPIVVATGAAQPVEPAMPAGAGKNISSLLDRVRNPKTREAALRELRQMPDPPENELLAQLDSPLVSNRFSAARALGAICDDQLAERMNRMIESDVGRREALAVLMSASDSSIARRLADSVGENDVIRSQMAALKSVMSEPF